MMMKHPFVKILWLLVFLSCSISTKEPAPADDSPSPPPEHPVSKDSVPQKQTAPPNAKDSTAVAIEESSPDTMKKSATKKVRKERFRLTRFDMLPGDDQWNGAPMTQQIEMPRAVLDNSPDTLSNLAVARYKTYDDYFPRSISDNFEEGISTEHVVYHKKLIFRFQVFEDEFSEKPYHTADVIIRRNDQGQPYAE